MKKKKKGVRNESITHVILVLLTILFITLIYYFIEPAFIGYTILEGNDWDTGNESNFNFNSEEIEIVNGIIKLKSNATSATWTTYSQQIFQVAKAYSDHEDKTSKVQSKNNDVQEIEPNKMAIFVFSSPLNNNEVINLYLEDEEATNVYLCSAYDECTSANLGQLYFPNQDGYYNITTQNLNSTSKIFNLNSDEEIKLDFINSTDINIAKLWYNPIDETSKVTTQDNITLNADKNKILDVIFNSELQSNDIIQVYLRNGESANIYLCNPAEECTSTNLGQLYFPNQDGYYNITTQNLNSTSKIFNLNSDEEIKLDFIEAIRVTETNHSETNTTYPESANITTQDLVINNLLQWDALVTEEDQAGQSIGYEYSTDSGESWQQIPEDKNLSSVNSTKIKIKAALSSNTTATPSISLINITYLTREPQTYFEVDTSSTISTIKDKSIIINSSLSKLELNITTTESLPNIVFNITELKDSRRSALSRVKELEIISPDLQNKISTATIKVYYTEDEVENLNESALKLYYYNETLAEWQSIDSTVNEEENYIEANLKHFSIYGIFGEETLATASSSSSGGPGGKREFTRGTNPPNQAVSQPQEQQSASSNAIEESGETPQENTEQQTIQTESTAPERSITGNIVNIGKILTDGKTNKSLWILFAILIVAYIITKIEEHEKEKKP